MPQPSINEISLEISFKSPRGQWVNPWNNATSPEISSAILMSCDEQRLFTAGVCSRESGLQFFNIVKPVYYQLRLKWLLPQLLSWPPSHLGHGTHTPFRLFAVVFTVALSSRLLLATSQTSLIARFMGPTWGPSGDNRTQVGPMLAPWTFLSGLGCTASQQLMILWNGLYSSLD